jgi:hypothetical protein
VRYVWIVSAVLPAPREARRPSSQDFLFLALLAPSALAWALDAWLAVNRVAGPHRFAAGTLVLLPFLVLCGAAVTLLVWRERWPAPVKVAAILFAWSYPLSVAGGVLPFLKLVAFLGGF